MKDTPACKLLSTRSGKAHLVEVHDKTFFHAQLNKACN